MMLKKSQVQCEEEYLALLYMYVKYPPKKTSMLLPFLHNIHITRKKISRLELVLNTPTFVVTRGPWATSLT